MCCRYIYILAFLSSDKVQVPILIDDLVALVGLLVNAVPFAVVFVYVLALNAVT